MTEAQSSALYFVAMRSAALRKIAALRIMLTIQTMTLLQRSQAASTNRSAHGMASQVTFALSDPSMASLMRASSAWCHLQRTLLSEGLICSAILPVLTWYGQ